jgi:hypothetical protein
MQRTWQNISVAQYAAFEQLLGAKTILSRGVYWSRVRPFFYRPLLAFQEHHAGSVDAPLGASLGGFQYAVPPGDLSNSTLNLLMFPEANSYSLDSLDYNRKRQIKQASKTFVVRPITDLAEFKKLAYPVYLSFVERTKYQHGINRRNRHHFEQWADGLFELSGVVVLGVYQQSALGGVSLSFLVENTLIYASFFCDTQSMRFHVSDLMLHFIRDAAALQGISRIFCGLCKPGNRLDDFYLLRGCEAVRKPAMVELNPLAEFVLARCLPNQYLQLHGSFETKLRSTGLEESATKADIRIPL